MDNPTVSEICLRLCGEAFQAWEDLANTAPELRGVVSSDQIALDQSSTGKASTVKSDKSTSQ